MTSHWSRAAAFTALFAGGCGVEPGVLGQRDAEVFATNHVPPADAAVWIDAQSARDGSAAPSEAGSSVVCGTDQVDVLFVIDNSGSMAEEQKKLADALPKLVAMLTTGNYQGDRAAPSDFPPVGSLHVGVVSTDMGINGITGQQSCGDVSFDPAAPDPSNPAPAVRQSPPSNALRFDKPRGDDGAMSTSIEVALAGIWARPQGATFATPVSAVVPADPSCIAVGAFPAGQRYVEIALSDSVSARERGQRQLGCIAKLGKNGCGFEQQLEAMLKALTPSTSGTRFVAESIGNGDVQNRGFLRPDAVLAVVLLSDEEDCSITDTLQARELFNPASVAISEELNIRCGLAKYQSLLHSVDRYVTGLKSLKAGRLQQRVIFTAIVGAPPQTMGNRRIYTGSAELDALLGREEMQFVPRPIAGTTSLFEATPACSSASSAGSAGPGRRFVEVAKQFADNGVVSSVCEDDYAHALFATVARIGIQLQVPPCLTN